MKMGTLSMSSDTLSHNCNDEPPLYFCLDFKNSMRKQGEELKGKEKGTEKVPSPRDSVWGVAVKVVRVSTAHSEVGHLQTGLLRAQGERHEH